MSKFAPVSIKQALQLGWVLVALASAGVVRAQDDPGDTPPYDHPDEIAALDGLFPALLPPPEGAALTEDDQLELIARSRLLSSPCDQLRWLMRQVQVLDRPDEHEPALALARLAVGRGESLERNGWLRGCGSVLEELRQRSQPPERRPDVGEPTEPPSSERQELLSAAREDDGAFDNLDAFDKFTLLSRGRRPTWLFTRDVPAWDMPRVVLDVLAEQVRLPEFWTLRKRQDMLEESYRQWSAGGRAPFDEPQQQMVAATFQIAAALLDRALGVPQDERAAAGHAGPILYEDIPAAWGQLAEALKGNAWSWATLAYILAGDADSAAEAQTLWLKVRAVNDSVWSALDVGEGSWLTRLTTAGQATRPGMLPLTRAFTQRGQRREQEDRLLSTISNVSDPNSQAMADQVLQAIQRVKAAELGLPEPTVPLGLDELTEALGGAQPWVYLFVELVEIRPQGADPFLHGVAVYRTKYAWPTKDRPSDDHYAAKILRRARSAEEAVRQALASPGPPADTKDARILIAPDGPLPPEWFAFERSDLLPRTSRPDIYGTWVVYVPSATALRRDCWTRDATLRAWWRSAMRPGRRPPAFLSEPRVLRKGAEGDLLKQPDVRLYLLSLGEAQGGLHRTLTELISAKREAELQLIPIIMGE